MNAIILHVGSLATRNIARNLQGDYLRAVGEMRHTRILESLSEDLSNEGTIEAEEFLTVVYVLMRYSEKGFILLWPSQLVFLWGTFRF